MNRFTLLAVWLRLNALKPTVMTLIITWLLCRFTPAVEIVWMTAAILSRPSHTWFLTDAILITLAAVGLIWVYCRKILAQYVDYWKAMTSADNQDRLH